MASLFWNWTQAQLAAEGNGRCWKFQLSLLQAQISIETPLYKNTSDVYVAQPPRNGGLVCTVDFNQTGRSGTTRNLFQKFINNIFKYMISKKHLLYHFLNMFGPFFGQLKKKRSKTGGDP